MTTCKHLLQGAPDCVFCHRDQLAHEITVLRNHLTAAQLERDEARRKLDYRNREPPHCPTCGCGLHPTTNEEKP